MTNRSRSAQILERLIVGQLLAGALAFASIKCGHETSTGPDVGGPPSAGIQAPGQAAVQPTPTPTPTPTPERARGPVSVVCGAASCMFSNSANVKHGILAQCTRPLQTNDWGSLGISVPPGENTASVTPYEICNTEKMGVTEIRCSDVNREVQLDFTAGAGEHIGHLFTTLVYKANPDDAWVPQSPIVTYGEWGECAPIVGASSVKSRSAEVPQCQRSRTKTTVINEVNSCTEKTREKSRVVTTESEPCDCPCVSQQIEQPPVRENEGEWGECSKRLSASTNNNPPPPQYTECPGIKGRTVEIVIYQIDSCTQVKTEKSRVTITETAECTYECLSELCHTEHDMWCGWLGCKNSWYLGAVKKWQCQNVPPGTPGHYPNHFNANQHADFFGLCNLDSCYEITN